MGSLQTEKESREVAHGWFMAKGQQRPLLELFRNKRNLIPQKTSDLPLKSGYLYAFVLKVPANKEVNIKSLSATLTLVNKIEGVELLGNPEKLSWQQTGNELQITLPDKIKSKYALAFKIKLDDKSRDTGDLILE